MFADIDPTSLSLDQNHALQLLTEKTRAIVPIHYAGIAHDYRNLKLSPPQRAAT